MSDLNLHYLTISALSTECPSLNQALSRLAASAGCNILNAKMTTYGAENLVNMLLSGSWSSIAKFEAGIPALEKKLKLSMIQKRTHEPEFDSAVLHYVASLISVDKPGIVSKVSDFFNSFGILMDDISVQTHLTPRYLRMLNMTIQLTIPAEQHLGSLREQFMTFCEAQNLDATLEPQMGHAF